MTTPREIEDLLEKDANTIRLLRERGWDIPADFHFPSTSAKLPADFVIPERRQFEPPQFTEEQRRRRIEAGLDPDRSMTLKELKAAGPPPERPETDPREIEQARQVMKTVSPFTAPKEFAKAFASFGVRALGNVWGERGIDVELPWIKPVTDAIIQGWGLDPAEVRKSPEKRFEGQYKDRGVPSAMLGTGKSILERAQKRARREAAPKTVPGQAARMAAALISGGATEEPMTVREARGVLPSLMFGAPPFTAMYGALQPSLQLNPFLARAQAIGGKPPFVPPGLRPAWPLGPPGKFDPRQVALEGYPGFPSTGLSIPRTPAARTVAEAAYAGRRAAADVGEEAPIVAGPAREAIEVPDGLSDLARGEFDRFNALTPDEQISRMQVINDAEVRIPGRFLGADYELTLKESVEAATRGEDPRQLRRLVKDERGAEVPEGNLLLKEGIWDKTDELTRKYPDSPETNIIPGPNARTATGEVARSLKEIDIAASRTAQAADIPTVRPAVQIGDDVVFPGPDGDITGRVVGKGVTEIEGVSRPHLSVRYEAPSGLPQQRVILEDMVRPTTAPTTPAVRAGAVARRDIPSGEAFNIGQLERQAVEEMSDEGLVLRLISDAEAGEIAERSTFEGAIPPVGIPGLRGRGAEDFAADQLDVFGEMVRRVNRAEDPLVEINKFASYVPDTAPDFFGSPSEFAEDLRRATRIELGPGPTSPSRQALPAARAAGLTPDEVTELARLKEQLAEVEALPPSTHPNKLNRAADTLWKMDQKKQLKEEIAGLEARQLADVPPTPAKIVDVPADAVPVPPSTPTGATIAGGRFKHFTTPEGKARLDAGEAFDPTLLPQHGTGDKGIGPKTGKFAGDRLYLSLDDERWSKVHQISTKGKIVKATPENEGMGGSAYFDYDKQDWFRPLDEDIVTTLSPVEFEIVSNARILEIDSISAYTQAKNKYGFLLDDDATWDRIARDYDAVAIRNVDRIVKETDDKFFRAIGGDQVIVLNPRVARVVTPDAQQIGQMQAGLGIGERSTQGQLLGEFVDEGGVVPLIDPEQAAASQARAEVIARGQLPLGEAAVTPTVPAVLREPLAESLPRDLARAKPGYSIGQSQYTPQFASDIDLALFIVANPRTRSKRDADYMAWLKDIFPDMDAAAIRKAGLEVRQHIKDTVSGLPPGDVGIPISRTVQNLRSMRRAAVEAPTVAPTAGVGGVPTTPTVSRIPPAVEEAAASLQTLRQELDDLTAQIEGMTEAGANIQRPSWGRGISNQEWDRAARSLGKSVYEPDWFDDIDVALRRDILKREYKLPGDETLTSMRSRLVGLRQEVKAAENQGARETAKITVPPVTVEVQTAAATKVIVEARVDRSASASGRLKPKQPPGTPTGTPAGTPPGGRDPRSVPPNDAYHPNIPTIEDVLNVNFKEDWVRTVSQRIQSIPIVGKEFIEEVNPSILAMDESKKGIIAFQHLRDSADTATTAAMQSIIELGNPLQVDSAGKALNIVIPKGLSPYIQDILTFPGRYPLNREQLEQVAQIKKLLQKSLDMQLEEGINIRPIRNFDDPARNISLELDVGKGQYFPRVIIGRVVEGVEEEIPGGAMRGGIGAVQARAKPRPWPTARQSIEEGNNILLADPVESVWVTIAAGYRAIAEKRFADFMKKQPGVATATDLLKQRHPEVVLARENALRDERNRRFAVNIIRDAFDPEKVPSDAAMRRLGREFPDVAEAIGLVNAGRRGQPSLMGQETAMDVSSQLSLLRSQREKLEGVADASRLRVSQTGNRYRALLSEIRQEPQVRQPAFRDIIMSREMADQIEAQLLDQPPAALRKIETFNDVLRMLETGLDPGFIFIQGAIPLMYRPQAWGKSFSITMQSLTDPAVAARYFQLPENRAVIDKMIQFSAAPLASSEYTAGVTVLGRIPVAGAAFRRGGAAFNVYLDVARIEMHKALGPLAKNADDYRQLTTTIDQMLGVMSPRQLGVTPTRRSLQGAFLLFAARYRRAGAALIGSLIRGGIRGHVARRALAHFFIGGAALMTGLAAVLGQTDLLDPRKGKNNIPPMYDPRYMGRFLSIRVGDSYWGIGGVSVSTVGLVASMYRGLSEDGVRGAAIEAFRRFRGLTSPFTSDVIDLATGKAGFTEEDTHTPFGITRMITEDVLPFFVAPFADGALEILEKRPFADMPGVETFVGNFIGTRERDISPYEKRTMQRDDIVASGNFMTIHGLPASEWSDLNSAQQKEIERTHPRMKLLNLEIEDSNYRRANNAKRSRLDRERLAREDFETKMTSNASNLTKGVEGYSKKVYDTKRKDIRTYNRAVTNTLWELRASSEARDVARIQKWVKENQTTEDAALDAFFDRRDTLFDELGVMTSAKWDTLDRELEDWLKKTYGVTVRDWVLAHKDDWILALPPLVRDLELFRARSIEAGTWFTGYRLPAHPTQYAGISDEIQATPENLGPYLKAIQQQQQGGRRPPPLIRPPSQPLQLVHDPLTSRFAGMR